MNLKTYLSGLRGRAASLAKAIRVTSVTIHNWAYDEGKQVPAERCPEIEKATSGQVTCEEMRPDVDWQVLRGSALPATSFTDVHETREGTPNV